MTRSSALMRAAHHLHGVLDMTPLAGFCGLAVMLAFQRIAGSFRNRRGTVPLEHLARDGVDLHLGCHLALPGFASPRGRAGSSGRASACPENR